MYVWFLIVEPDREWDGCMCVDGKKEASRTPMQVGSTALIEATFFGHLPVVEYLVGSGALVETRNKSGVTALIAASTRGRLEVVNFFARSGASLDVQENDGSTALIDAVFFGHLRVVELLVWYGARTDIKIRRTVVANLKGLNRTRTHAYVAIVVRSRLGSDVRGR